MRIAYICADPGVPVFGQKGCSIHVQEVIRSLLRQGAQVELFATRLGGDPPAGLETVAVHELPAIPKGEQAVREQAALSANLDLRLALEREAPFDLVYERYSLWSFTAMEYARSVGITGLLEVNAPLIEEQEKYRGLSDRTSAERVAKGVFSTATALIAVSEEIKTYLKGYPGVGQRVHVIPNGVNPDRFPSNITPSLPASPGTFTVGFVGTLKPWHGLPVLVKAFDRLYQQCSETRLLIVGDGPERENLLADLLARGLLNAAYLTGAVAPSEIPGLLASMTVAVAPYPAQTDFYFSPLKVYEYMAAELPVVASHIGQLKSLIEDKTNGLLVPPGNPIALATALDRLRQDSNLANCLGQAARKTMRQNHTWDAVTQRILHLAGFDRVSQLSVGAKR
ncbi:glycosyltransferase [Lyngbya aestuarii]|uniref:glycosyltransferase n=1 Tax=Lyngbya aestuarii TaxID=118322 RepID=UPI00403DFBE7